MIRESIISCWSGTAFSSGVCVCVYVCGEGGGGLLTPIGVNKETKLSSYFNKWYGNTRNSKTNSVCLIQTFFQKPSATAGASHVTLTS